MATITYDTELMNSAVLGQSNQMREIKSYTITISVLDADDFPLSSGQIVIGASPAVAGANVNGVETTLTSPGNWYALDSSGCATLIVETESITSSNFWVTGAQDSTKKPVALNPVTGVILNPSHKVISAFSSIKQHQNLADVRGQSGDPLWPNGNHPNEHKMNQALQVLQNSEQMLSDVHQANPVMNLVARSANAEQIAMERGAHIRAAAAAATGSTAHVQGASMTHIRAESRPHIQEKLSLVGPLHRIGHDIGNVGHDIANVGHDAGNGIDHIGHQVGDGIGSIVHGLPGIFTHATDFIGRGFESKLRDVKSFTTKKVDGDWHFIVESEKGLQHFIVKDIQELSAVLDFVWGQLGLGIDKLIDFAGFLFEWDDVSKTSKFIQNMLNATFDYGKTEIDVLSRRIDSFFANTKSKIKGRIENHKSAPASGTGQISTATTKSLSTAKGPTVGKSPALNFLNERYQNAGMQSASMSQTPSAGNSQFGQSVMPFTKTMKVDLDGIGRDLTKIFKSFKSLHTADIWGALVNDTFDTMIDILNSIVREVLKGVRDLVQALEKMGNASIHIPIISDLLKVHGFGDLSAFSLVCTLLGFMVCVFYKLTTQKRLSLPTENPEILIKMLFNGEVLEAEKQTISVIEMIGEFGVTLGMRIYTTVSMAKALAEQGPTGGAAGGLKNLSPSTMTGPLSIKSLPSLAKTSLKLISSIFSLHCDKSKPGYEFSQAAAAVSFINTIGTVVYTFTAEGLPEEVQAIEEFYLITALINFALYDGAAAEMAIAAVEGASSQIKQSNALATEQYATENVCNTVASCGQYVGMTTAMTVDETAEETAGVAELLEAVAIGGFAVYCGANDALLVNKAANVVTAIRTEADDVRGVASNP